MENQKLELDRIIDILSKIKEDDFYFKSYSKDIIKSYINQETQQMYSEEEVLDILFSMSVDNPNNITKWFKQFKNK